jgi:uncharacterized protein (DUF1330 family)
MKFPSYERALEWYHSKEYKELKDLRIGSAPADIVLIEAWPSTKHARSHER